MYNRCENKLTIAGDSQIVDRFLSENDPKYCKELNDFYKRKHSIVDDGQVEFIELQGVLTFWGTCPRPSSCDSIWERWNCDNWGTTNDININDCDIILKTSNKVIICFSTIRSPPEQWIHSIAVKYPTLDFELYYEKIISDFYGIMQYDQGVLIMNASGSYSDRIHEDFLRRKDLIVQIVFDKFFKNNWDRIETLASDNTPGDVVQKIFDRIEEYIAYDEMIFDIRSAEDCCNTIRENCKKVWWREERNKALWILAKLVKNNKMNSDTSSLIYQQFLLLQK